MGKILVWEDSHDSRVIFKQLAAAFVSTTGVAVTSTKIVELMSAEKVQYLLVSGQQASNTSIKKILR
jgi:hypothetical protein